MRTAPGAPGAPPVRVAEAEACLLGTALDDEAVHAAAAILAAASDPVDDVRGSAEYRLILVPRLLARALAAAINFLDPDVIVLGGGLSAISSLYTNVPRVWARYASSNAALTRLVKAEHGPDSGVRGAAWL